MQTEIQKLNHEILQACFDAKAKGHDVFYEYSPHVGKSYLAVHLNGWNKDKSKKPDHYFYSLCAGEVDNYQNEIDRLIQVRDFIINL